PADPSLPQLRDVRYHQAREVRADHARAPALGHADEVHALLRRGEPPAVTAGRDLLEGDDGPLPARRHHPHLGVEEVDELALAVDGLDGDLADAVLAAHAGHRVAAGAALEGPAGEPSPELVEVAPAHPEAAPP